MASVKKTADKSIVPQQATLFEKIGEQASHLKEEIIAGKDHLLEVAGEKFASVKKTIKAYTRKKAAKAKKNLVSQKKVTGAKKAAKNPGRSAKVAAKKITAGKNTAIKKAPATKKPVKKAAKKKI